MCMKETLCQLYYSQKFISNRWLTSDEKQHRWSDMTHSKKAADSNGGERESHQEQAETWGSPEAESCRSWRSSWLGHQHRNGKVGADKHCPESPAEASGRFTLQKTGANLTLFMHSLNEQVLFVTAWSCARYSSRPWGRCDHQTPALKKLNCSGISIKLAKALQVMPATVVSFCFLENALKRQRCLSWKMLNKWGDIMRIKTESLGTGQGIEIIVYFFLEDCSLPSLVGTIRHGGDKHGAFVHGCRVDNSSWPHCCRMVMEACTGLRCNKVTDIENAQTPSVRPAEAPFRSWQSPWSQSSRGQSVFRG